ncbi:MAG: hypothetical protein IVW52_19755 [Acidimicrobiales bacterium]|nr:hypothetical protein [Acidimicrobiales bacterium]
MGTEGLEARDALAAALEALGCSLAEEPRYGDQHPDLVVSTPNGTTVALEVKAAAHLDPASVQRLVRTGPERDSVTVFVADRISEAARASLADEGLSWFDRRGHLRLIAPGVFIDAETAPVERFTETKADGIKGRAGMAYAVASLLSPQEGPTIRGVARGGGLSAPSVSVAAASLRRAALVDDGGRPLLPDLFWAVAEQWKPTFVPLGGNLTSTLAGQADRLGVFGDPADPGWSLTGTVGAYAWGAPLVAASDLPPEFYVPDSRTLALARRVFGDSTPGQHSCSIAIAPTPAACEPRSNLPGATAVEFGQFLFTRPLFVALELANDPARGREILADWTPEDGSRVW